MEINVTAKNKTVPAKKVAAKKKATTPVKKVEAKKASAKKKTSAGAKPGRPKKQVAEGISLTTSNDGFTISVSTPGINPIAMPSNSTSTNATGSVPAINVAAAVIAAIPEHTKKSVLKRLFSIFKRAPKR